MAQFNIASALHQSLAGAGQQIAQHRMQQQALRQEQMRKEMEQQRQMQRKQADLQTVMSAGVPEPRRQVDRRMHAILEDPTQVPTDRDVLDARERRMREAHRKTESDLMQALGRVQTPAGMQLGVQMLQGAQQQRQGLEMAPLERERERLEQQQEFQREQVTAQQDFQRDLLAEEHKAGLTTFSQPQVFEMPDGSRRTVINKRQAEQLAQAGGHPVDERDPHIEPGDLFSRAEIMRTRAAGIESGEHMDADIFGDRAREMAGTLRNRAKAHEQIARKLAAGEITDKQAFERIERIDRDTPTIPTEDFDPTHVPAPDRPEDRPGTMEYQPIAGTEKTRMTPEDARAGIGPVSKILDVLNRTVGAFFGSGMIAPDTAEAKQHLRQMRHMLMQEMKISTHGHRLDIDLMRSYMPDPEAVFEDPAFLPKQLKMIRGELQNNIDYINNKLEQEDLPSDVIRALHSDKETLERGKNMIPQPEKAAAEAVTVDDIRGMDADQLRQLDIGQITDDARLDALEQRINVLEEEGKLQPAREEEEKGDHSPHKIRRRVR